jgi:hypothetical protein
VKGRGYIGSNNSNEKLEAVPEIKESEIEILRRAKKIF